MRKIAVILSLFSVLALSGCPWDGGGPSAPEPPSNFAGSWRGSLNSTLLGSAIASVDITQSDTSLSGRWVSDFADPSSDDGGTITGTVSGSTAELTFTPFNPSSCSFDASISIENDTITGSYVAVDCAVSDSGSFSVSEVPASSILDVSGVWSGPVSSTVAGDGTVSIELVQSGLVITGTWNSVFARSTFDASGQLAGTIDGDIIVFTLIPDDPSDCPITATIELAQGTFETLQGSFSTFDCIGGGPGEFSATQPSETPDIAGQWVGGIVTDVNSLISSAGVFSFDIELDGEIVSAISSTSYFDSSLNATNTFSGTLVGEVLDLTFRPELLPGCEFSVAAEVSRTSLIGEIAGTFESMGCPIFQSGEFFAIPASSEPNQDLTGIWTSFDGSVEFIGTDALGGSLELNLRQSGDQIEGEYFFFASGTGTNNNGTLSGTREGNIATLSLVPSGLSTGCPVSTSIVLSGGVLHGFWGVTDCSYSQYGKYALRLR